MQFTEIKIKGLPTVYNKDFEDSFFSRNRVLKQPDPYSVVNKTKAFHSIVHDSDRITKQRTIQTILYDKYILEYYCNENNNIFNAKYAEIITVVKPDGTELTGEIIDFSYERLEQTTSYKITITFINTDIDTRTVNNFLSYPECLLNEGDDENATLNWFSVSTNLVGGQTVDQILGYLADGKKFYTKIDLIYGISEAERKTTKETGTEYVTNTVYFRTVTAIFYLSEVEKNKLLELQQWMRVNDEGSWVYDKRTATLHTTILEPWEVEVTENDNFTDLYECKVTAKYEKFIRNPFNEG